MGSGKSSLLSALLGEMTRTEGVLNINVGCLFYLVSKACNCMLQEDREPAAETMPALYKLLQGPPFALA